MYVLSLCFPSWLVVRRAGCGCLVVGEDGDCDGSFLCAPIILTYCIGDTICCCGPLEIFSTWCLVVADFAMCDSLAYVFSVQCLFDTFPVTVAVVMVWTGGRRSAHFHHCCMLADREAAEKAGQARQSGESDQ